MVNHGEHVYICKCYLFQCDTVIMIHVSEIRFSIT